MTPVRHVVYLHGFTSSPASSKAVRFRTELERAGVTVDCPDLNLPAFETLTITRMLEQVRQALANAPAEPVALIGSSLGGFVALHAAAQGAEPSKVDRLVLLAPAVEFGGRTRDRTFGSLRPAGRDWPLGHGGIEEWRRTGHVSVLHYAENRQRELGFQLYEDAARYDAFDLRLSLPILIFQGTHDDAVDPDSVQRWASGRPNVDLRLVDDGHQLSASIDLIWAESRSFLGLQF